MSSITNMGSFLASIRGEQTKFEDAVDKRTKAIASNVLIGVVDATPVAAEDGGEHKGGWQVAINVTPTNRLDVKDPDGGATKAAGLATIAAAPKNSDIVIVNNAPAIARLNDGYSSQAPAGFVEIAVDKANRSIP